MTGSLGDATVEKCSDSLGLHYEILQTAAFPHQKDFLWFTVSEEVSE